MKEFFKEWNAKPESLAVVDTANDIIREYRTDGYTLTLRQLYYQFVSRDLIENSINSYKNLGKIITNGRMAGLISWDAIEDRNREHNDFWVSEDPTDEISRLPYGIRFDQWERQDSYVEVWVEKDALVSVIEQACNPYRVPYMACKGYLSASEAYRAGKRFKYQAERGKNCVLIHLGDHDPSGIDMTRDNDDRIELFSDHNFVDVRRIALNMNQVHEYNPPPNPAKITDSRAKEYIKRYGRESWELDALEPKVIKRLIQDEIDQLIDDDIWRDVTEQEKEVQNDLIKLADNWEAVKDYLQELE